VTLLDSAMTCAVVTALAAGEGCTTAETKVNFVRPVLASTGPFRAEGRLIHAGARLGTAEGRLTDAAGRLGAPSAARSSTDRGSAGTRGAMIRQPIELSAGAPACA
jgi:uncharacterized protein (TIGR00369 family)